MPDSDGNQEAPERVGVASATGERLSGRGIASVQGAPDGSEGKETFPDQSYTDAAGRNLTMRTYPNGDSYMVRVSDDERVPHSPAPFDLGQAGRANLHLERDWEGRVAGAKLQDIETMSAYQGAGTGGRMLEQCEYVARDHGATKITGVFDPKHGEEEKTRRFYEKRGYVFSQNGKEISKPL